MEKGQMEEGKVEEGEMTLMKKEQRFLREVQGIVVLQQLEQLLRGSCRQLHVNGKLDERLRLPSNPTPQTERLALVPRNGSDALRSNVTLLAENIIQTDIAIRYPKVPGGVLRSVAHPDVQWKLQQVQDCGNYCIRALTLVINQLESSTACESPHRLLATLEAISESLSAARSSLCLPRKRSLLELCHFRPTRCFNPPLPPDLLLSYYISSTRIVCAAYQLCPAPTRATGPTATSALVQQSLNMIQAECVLPHLAQVLQMLNAALQVAQQLRFKLVVLNQSLEVD